MSVPSSVVHAVAVPRTAPGTPNPTGGAEHRAWVVGLGTPFGDDCAGWAVVARLRDVLPSGARSEGRSDPLVVLDARPEDELLIVIDACRGAGPEASVHRFVWPDPRLIAGSGVSSHGIGLTAALELAAALGRLPSRVVVFAIEADAAEPGANLSRAVEAALPEVVARVLAEIMNRAGAEDE